MAERFRMWRADPYSAHRDGRVLRLTGDIDVDNWPETAERIVAGVRAGIVRLDMTQVDFFGAAGIRALLSGRDALPPGASLEVTCGRSVFRVLQVCGLIDTDGLVVVPAPHLERLPDAGV